MQKTKLAQSLAQTVCFYSRSDDGKRLDSDEMHVVSGLWHDYAARTKWPISINTGKNIIKRGGQYGKSERKNTSSPMHILI